MKRRPLPSVRAEYARLAECYDRRWGRYVAGSVRHALGRLAPRPGDSVLDLGCGTGVLLAHALRAKPGIRAWGADLSHPMLARARRRLPPEVALVQADAGRLPFADASFDHAVSTSALHYWPDPAGAMAELARVVRPGGAVLIADWCGDHWRTRLAAWLLRRAGRPLGRVFRVRELESLMRDSGFRETSARRFRAGGWRLVSMAARR